MPLAIRYPGWRVQPWEAAQHLASAAEAAGVEIVPGTEALRLVPEGGKVRVLTASGDIVARQVVVATNAYGNGFGGRRPGLTVFSYVLATERLTEAQCQSLGGEAALYSELDTDIYRRVHDGRLVFGALDKLHRRADEDWAADPAARAELRRMLAGHLPELSGVAIEEEWGGAFCQRLHAPVIAPHRRLKGVYFNTGYGGSGVSLTLSSGALVPGMLWPELETDTTAMLRRAYSQTRVPWLGLPGMALAALGAR
jgi:glycine/D-amino acid oxidase-like deaminating enzyme